MRRRFRVGIVGCGGIARAHAEGYRNAGAAVVSVHDVARRAAEAFAEQTGGRVAASPGEMIREDALDAVSICTPPAVHLDNCRPFLKAGVPILCEKPLELDPARAARLAREVKKHRALFMVAFCHRFHPPIIEMKRLIDKGVLGKPVLMRNIFGGYNNLKGNHRIRPELSGGGCLIDHCAHSVDLFRYLVGDPDEVHAVKANIAQKIPVEDFGIIQFVRKGTMFGEIIGTYSLKVCGNWIEWYGSKGMATVSYWNPGAPDLSYQVEGQAEATAVDCSKHPDRFTGEIRHFLDCVQKGRKPSITVDDGAISNRIIGAVYRSAETARRIRLRGGR